MTPALSSTGLVLHELGLATGFGGSLFGKIALNPSVKAISSKEERGQVTNLAWNGFNIVNAVAVGTSALTWFIGRSRLTGREIDNTTRVLTLVKDILIGSTLVLGAANIVSGGMLAKQAPDGAVPSETGLKPTDNTPQKAVTLMKFIDVAGILNIACMAGVIGVTALLNMKAGASSKWSALSRFLP
jgi:hypothetical protein